MILAFMTPLLELAMELEDIALEDDYFIDKKLYPNVDFYSGIILKAMGFPTSMFTVLFAVARTVGWVAQWNEMITDPMQRIGRPRQLYTGPAQRPSSILASAVSLQPPRRVHPGRHRSRDVSLRTRRRLRAEARAAQSRLRRLSPRPSHLQGLSAAPVQDSRGLASF